MFQTHLKILFVRHTKTVLYITFTNQSLVMNKSVDGDFENIVWKVENAGNQHLLLQQLRFPSFVRNILLTLYQRRKVA